MKPSDLAELVSPRISRQRSGGRATKPEQVVIASLTEEQQRRGLEAFTELKRLRADLAAKHGRLTPESWELLNEAREEHTNELMRALEG